MLLVRIKTCVRARWEEDLLDALDPLLFLLCCWCWDAVERVVSFHNPTICFSLTGFDDLILVVWDEEFKAVLCKESYFRRSFYPFSTLNHKHISLEQTEVTRTMTAVYERDFSKPVTSTQSSKLNIFKQTFSKSSSTLFGQLLDKQGVARMKKKTTTIIIIIIQLKRKTKTKTIK